MNLIMQRLEVNIMLRLVQDTPEIKVHNKLPQQAPNMAVLSKLKRKIVVIFLKIFIIDISSAMYLQKENTTMIS